MEKRKRSIDMLSGLPDDVLCHVLSFLPTKRSVCTSVLSKRWRFLWAHVRNLQFDGYLSRNGIPKVKGCVIDLDIIIRVIMLHEAKILNTFILSLSNAKGCAYQLDTLIIYPIKRNVRKLYLDFSYKYGDEIVCSLPRLLFTCKTLVDLKLSNCGLIPSSGELFLPRLKKLDLSYVDYENDESLPHLLSGCPVIEELIVNHCCREGQQNSGCLIVSSPTIKSLYVNFYPVADPCPDEMFIIDLPALVCLKVYGCHLGHVKSLRKTMTSLILAKMTVNGDSCPCGSYCNEHVRSTEFLSCLSHVKYLKISNIFEDKFVHLVGTGTMPKFVNLTKLKLIVIVELYDLVKFLDVADNLQVLFIHLHKTSPCEPKQVPLCMLSRLRTVFFHDFNHCEDDFEDALDMVRYILRNAQVLETMEIFSACIPWEDKVDVLRRISLFERGSKSCQLVFTPPAR